MAFHGRCIVLDTHALFPHVHQFSFTCHGAGSMEKGKQGEGGEKRDKLNLTALAELARPGLAACSPASLCKDLPAKR